MPGRRFWLLAPGFWLLVSSVGCSGTIHPPRIQSDSIPVYVTDYGRHSSLVLPDDHGGYVEWAFGDWNWFALGHTKWYNAINAVIVSPQATLARRSIPAQPDDEAIRVALGAQKLMRIYVRSSPARTLLHSLEPRYNRHIDTQIHSDYSKMDHVKDDDFYWGLHNCNHVTADWLRRLGARVEGFTLLSKFKLAE